MDRAARNDRTRIADGHRRSRLSRGLRNLTRSATIVFALAAALFAGCQHDEPKAPPPVNAFGEPKPVATPTPPPPWSSTDEADLQRRLGDIFTSNIIQSSTGLAVVAADGHTLYEHRGTIPVTPASTLKLVIGASALDTFGPNHRFYTRLVSNAKPDPDGTLRGDVWLVGGGDPALVSDDLRRGVGTLYRTGVRRIDGSLYVDDTAFSGPEQNPRWDPDDLTYDYAAGTSAVAIDWGVIEFDVTPDPSGGAAQVETHPANSYVAYEGTIGSAPSWYDSDVTIDRKPATGPATIDFTLGGRIAQGETQKFYRPVVGIAQYTGSVVATMMAERGIALAGGFRLGPAPPGATILWSHPSPPLDDILTDMLVNSNNHTAETLLRFLGQTAGKPGTDASGIAAEKHVLAGLAVPHDRMTVYDGSGLSPVDRIMPLTLAKLISAQTRSAVAANFVRALPRVGMDGTVKHHDLHVALGIARAKSGHIGGVNGLAGTIPTKRHGRVSFAFIVNAPNANADVVTEEEDRAIDAIAAM